MRHGAAKIRTRICTVKHYSSRRNNLNTLFNLLGQVKIKRQNDEERQRLLKKYIERGWAFEPPPEKEVEMKKYSVCLRKEYFPKHMWPTETTLVAASFVVIAESRQEAAKEAWEKIKNKTLHNKLPHVKRISLHVGKNICDALRLEPINVWESK